MRLLTFLPIILFVTTIVISDHITAGSEPLNQDRKIVAITSTGSSLESVVSQNFGRCPYFIFYDSKENKITAFENPGLRLESGAGRRAAELVINSGATILITGNIGDKVKSQLKNAGIQIITDLEKTSTVKNALEMIQSGFKYE